MTLYKAIIVEDLPRESKYLANRLQALFTDIRVLSVCETIDRARIDITGLQPQLVFLDIELGSENGFDLLKDLAYKSFKVIFVTGRPDKVLDALRVSAVDYLQKPYEDEDLIKAVNRAKEALDKESVPDISGKVDLLLQNLTAKPEQPKTLAVTNKDGQHRILLTDLLYCSTTRESTSEGNMSVRILFRLTDGKSIIASNTSLKHYEEVLTPYGFARIADPFLINIRHIKTYQKKGGKIIMKGYYDTDRKRTIEEDMYVSDAKKDWFNKFYGDSGINLV